MARPRKRVTRRAHIDPAQAFTIDEFCAHMKISRAQYYVLVQRGAVRPMPDFSPPRISGAEVLRITSASQAAS